MSVDPEVQTYPFGEAERLDVHPAYLKAQADDGLTKVQPPFGRWTWLATRHADVKAVLADPRLSRTAVIGDDEPRVHPFVPDKDALSALDPPEHTRLRRVLMGAFTTRRMEILRPRVQRVVDEALDGVEEHGQPADLVPLFASAVPGTVICELLGVPVADRPSFRAWSDVVLTADAQTPPEEVFGAYQQLTGYLMTQLAQRRENPSEDLLSTLVQAADVNEKLTDNEMVGLATAVLVAGHETTVSQIASFTHVLLTHPDQLAKLRARPDMMPHAIEELLRFCPVMSTAGFAREAKEDVVVGGTAVSTGEAVMPTITAANFDCSVFTEPDRLDLERENATSHLAFSHGPHHCPGSQLARMELQVSISSLLARFPKLRLAVPADEVPWRRHSLSRGPLSLPISW